MKDLLSLSLLGEGKTTTSFGISERELGVGGTCVCVGTTRQELLTMVYAYPTMVTVAQASYCRDELVLSDSSEGRKLDKDIG